MTSLQLAASVALFATQDVLLIQRARQPYKGLWTLPGGKVEPEESAEHCALREVQEELGLTVEALVPVVVHRLASYELSVFASRTFSGTPKPSSEIADWRWCQLEEIGKLPTTPGLLEILTKAKKKLGI